MVPKSSGKEGVGVLPGSNPGGRNNRYARLETLAGRSSLGRGGLRRTLFVSCTFLRPAG